VENNRSKALLTLAKLLSQRDSGMEIRMLAGLSNEYQKLIQTRLAMKQLNINRANPNSFSALPPEVKERFPDNPLLKMHPYRAFKTCEAASRFSGNSLAMKLTAIRDASRALVSGGGDSRILLEQLVCKLTAR
jgi:DNA polymerase III delta subunit